jgi:hypothetical protein
MQLAPPPIFLNDLQKSHSLYEHELTVTLVQLKSIMSDLDICKSLITLNRHRGKDIISGRRLSQYTLSIKHNINTLLSLGFKTCKMETSQYLYTIKITTNSLVNIFLYMPTSFRSSSCHVIVNIYRYTHEAVSNKIRRHHSYAFTVACPENKMLTDSQVLVSFIHSSFVRSTVHLTTNP